MTNAFTYQEFNPSNESYWRSIILFGLNVASYKFALGQALLELSRQNKTEITAEELAAPYVKYLCEHIKAADKQGTSSKSLFLDSIRKYGKEEISYDEIINITRERGFNNVLDAFHKVNRQEVPNRYFHKRGAGNRSGIVLTDNIFLLNDKLDNMDLGLEIESRWKLVETAWNLGIPTSALEIRYDKSHELLYIEQSNIPRRDVTWARHALNGYQKSKCFYCYSDIIVDSDKCNCDVDHFIPHMLQKYMPYNLDGAWNLVLACEECNRGRDGKFDRLPHIDCLERLYNRNLYLIESHHPLRETIINQTGKSDEARRRFLNSVYQDAYSLRPVVPWKAPIRKIEVNI
jgi:hypothetical protein